MKMIEYEVIISEQATNDMTEIYNYIYSSIGMPQIAMAQFTRIAKAIETLSTFPERIKVFYQDEQSGEQFRQLLIDNYSVIFTINYNTVNIVRVAYSPSNIKDKISQP